MRYSSAILRRRQTRLLFQLQNMYDALLKYNWILHTWCSFWQRLFRADSNTVEWVIIIILAFEIRIQFCIGYSRQQHHNHKITQSRIQGWSIYGLSWTFMFNKVAYTALKWQFMWNKWLKITVLKKSALLCWRLSTFFTVERYVFYANHAVYVTLLNIYVHFNLYL